jgi:hypothetical protein
MHLRPESSVLAEPRWREISVEVSEQLDITASLYHFLGESQLIQLPPSTFSVCAVM